MLIGPDLRPDFTHDAIFIDEKSGALDAHERFPIHALFAVNAIEPRNAGLTIGEQREGQAVLVGEFLVRGSTIGAYAQYDDAALLHQMVRITEAARLFCAAGCVVLRIEVKYYCLSAQVGKMDLAVLHYVVAAYRWQRKIGSWLRLFHVYGNAHKLSPLPRVYQIGGAKASLRLRRSLFIWCGVGQARSAWPTPHHISFILRHRRVYVPHRYASASIRCRATRA